MLSTDQLKKAHSKRLQILLRESIESSALQSVSKKQIRSQISKLFFRVKAIKSLKLPFEVNQQDSLLIQLLQDREIKALEHHLFIEGALSLLGLQFVVKSQEIKALTINRPLATKSFLDSLTSKEIFIGRALIFHQVKEVHLQRLLVYLSLSRLLTN